MAIPTSYYETKTPKGTEQLNFEKFSPVLLGSLLSCLLAKHGESVTKGLAVHADILAVVCIDQAVIRRLFPSGVYLVRSCRRNG